MYNYRIMKMKRPRFGADSLRKGRIIMICNKCGGELEDGALFCARCGAQVETADTSTPETENSAENPAQQPEPAAQTPAEPETPRPNPGPEPVFQPKPQGQSVSLGTWICRYAINFIPCVGSLVFLIMLFVWSTDKKYDETSRNWAKANLIFMGISIVISIIVVIFVCIALIPRVVYHNTYYNGFEPNLFDGIY